MGGISLTSLVFHTVFVVFSVLAMNVAVRACRLDVGAVGRRMGEGLRRASDLVAGCLGRELSVLRVERSASTNDLKLRSSSGRSQMLDLRRCFRNVRSGSSCGDPSFHFVRVSGTLC